MPGDPRDIELRRPLFEPQSTVAVILGASTTPQIPSLPDAPTIQASANLFAQYLLAADGLALRSDRLLNLFDSAASASQQVSEIRQFLLTPSHSTSDVLLYFVGWCMH